MTSKLMQSEPPSISTLPQLLFLSDIEIARTDV